MQAANYVEIKPRGMMAGIHCISSNYKQLSALKSAKPLFHVLRMSQLQGKCGPPTEGGTFIKANAKELMETCHPQVEEKCSTSSLQILKWVSR